MVTKVLRLKNLAHHFPKHTARNGMPGSEANYGFHDEVKFWANL
jgi:hypothetical protein